MANMITLSRFPLLILILLLLFYGGAPGQLVSAFLIILLILMDSLDGFIARRRNESSLLGSALDIAADRSVELLLWVSYAKLGLIPLIIPLAVILRGTLTDSIRSVASSLGVRAFDMSQRSWTRFLIASSWMRSSYGAAKAIAFSTLALWLGLTTLWGPAPASPSQEALISITRAIALVSTWVAFALCMARGVPVLIDAPAFFREYEAKRS